MLKVIILVVLVILHFIMLGTMIIFERNKPRSLISWSIIFAFTSFLGGFVYMLNKVLQKQKIHSLKIKLAEDEVYRGLVSKELYKSKSDIKDEISSFAIRAYNSKLTNKNSVDVINSYEKLDEIVSRDIMSASKYVLLEANRFNLKSFEKIKPAIIAKAESGVMVKVCYEHHISRTILKELKLAGVKVYRFSKYNRLSGLNANLKNTLVVDGFVAYVADFNNRIKDNKKGVSVAYAALRLKGEIAQEIDIALRQDIVFASGKFIEYSKPKRELPSNTARMQYICNNAENNLELMIVKAISQARTSIQMELSEFVPTESIMSLLKFALNSNIDVRLIVPFKTPDVVKFYATRAYAKELALAGADVYLFDGRIAFNSIIIDGQTLLFGNYTMDRDYIMNNTQNIVLSNDEKLIENFNKKFDASIENSYRINDAKYVLNKEKFFKSLV